MLTIYSLTLYIENLGLLDYISKNILSSFLSFLLSFLFALYILPRILLISRKKRLFDLHDSRKCHSGEVPRLGGLVFVPAIVCTMSLSIAFRYCIDFPVDALWVNHALKDFLFLISGISFLYLVGVKDDLIGVRYRNKFLAQFFVAALIPCSGLYINQLYGLFGVYAIPFWIGIPITTLLIVFITNSINLIDGIDGLAAGGCSLSFLVFGLLFADRGLYLYSMLSFTALGCLLPFAYYNIFGQALKGRKLFMGDSGSLTLGYLLSFLTIRYAMYMPDHNLPYNVNSLIVPFSILFIPCFDTLRVMIVRAYNRQPLFLGDRSHIHHKCLSAGMSHIQATCFLVSYAFIMILENIYVVEFLNINVVVLLNVTLFLLIVWTLNKNKR